MPKIIQYTANRSTSMYGIKRYNNNIQDHLKDIDTDLTIHNKHIEDLNGIKTLNVKTAFRTIPDCFNSSTIHHFTDPNMFPMGLVPIKNKIISLMDCIEYHFYLEVETIANYRSKCFPKFDKIITISNYSKQDISQVYNIDLSKIEIIYPSVNTSDFYYSPGLTTQGGNRDVITLFYAGNTMPHKNLSFLIDVIRIAQDYTGKQIVLYRAGYADKNDLVQYLELKMLKQKAQLAGVDFRNLGLITNDELRFMYNSCDMYVCSSVSEGFNLPMVEAMACGTPIIVSDVACHREISDINYLDGTGKVGYVLPFNATLWAQKIVEVASWGKNHYKVHCQARANNFTPEKSIQQLYKIYNSMIN